MKQIILKLCAVLLFIIIVFIFIQYLNILKLNKENTHSHTENNLNQGDEIIHTMINPNINNINIENFEEAKKCGFDTSNIFYLHLTTSQLEGIRYKPEPFWTNEIFCIYKTKRILSLDDSISIDNAKDEDFYYPLGDVILFKNYDNYMTSYKENLKIYNANIDQCSKTTLDESNALTPSVSNTIEFFEDKYPNADSNISNYNQPGIIGLKILVKNGKKPVGFEPLPVCVISKTNGMNLYVWKPIAPEGYIFLGNVCTVSMNPNIPLIDTCHIRALPQECLYAIDYNPDNSNLVLSKDIKVPYTLNLVSNGKYFNGGINIGNKKEINSYDLSSNCLNIERDNNDIERIMAIDLMLDEDTNLEEYELNSFKKDLEKIMFDSMINDSELKLNDFTNNFEIDYNIFKQDEETINKNKRLKIEVTSFITNKVLVKITFKQRPFAYNELSNEKLLQKMKTKYENLFTFTLSVNGKKYNFKPTKYEILVGIELQDNIKHYNNQLNDLKEQRSVLEKMMYEIELTENNKSLLTELISNIKTIEMQLQQDINNNQNTGKDFVLSSNLLDTISQFNNKNNEVIKIFEKDTKLSELNKTLNNIKSIIQLILDKDLVPSKLPKPPINGIDPNLLEDAESAVRLALGVADNVPLDIRRSRIPPDFEMPQF